MKSVSRLVRSRMGKWRRGATSTPDVLGTCLRDLTIEAAVTGLPGPRPFLSVVQIHRDGRAVGVLATADPELLSAAIMASRALLRADALLVVVEGPDDSVLGLALRGDGVVGHTEAQCQIIGDELMAIEDHEFSAEWWTWADTVADAALKNWTAHDLIASVPQILGVLPPTPCDGPEAHEQDAFMMRAFNAGNPAIRGGLYSEPGSRFDYALRTWYPTVLRLGLGPAESAPR